MVKAEKFLSKLLAASSQLQVLLIALVACCWTTPSLSLAVSLAQSASGAKSVFNPTCGGDSNRGWSGNGGDLPKDQHNAWFLKTADSESVPYCVKVDPKFSFSKFRVALLVEGAIAEWKKFFERHGLDQFSLGGDPRLQFPDGVARKVNLNFSEVPCNDKDPELVTFLFGAKSTEIQSYLDANGPSLAVALRRSFDHLTFRTGGTVWVSDFTKSEAKLKHLIMHEVGHVLGLKHDSTFVMDEKVYEFLTAYSEVFNQSEIAVTESRRWPYRVVRGDVIELYEANPWTTKLGFKPNSVLPVSLREALGLQEGGYHKMKLRWNLSQSGEHAYSLLIEPMEGGPLKIFDGKLVPQDRILENQMGPGLFTKFIDTKAAASLGVFVRATFDQRPLDLPAKGFFTIGKSKVPATLDFQRGLELSLFDDSGQWSKIEK